ncbi:MAG: ribosome biogenesis GTPase Der [Armatimonadetes bacterium]|nr:ribosome biogenesis GTPase Der [Armatimonadota bacterium]NIM23118.1 ribosome biogenesis GTPase Der [Armatimonadota bacterium]NIM66986.1 ribosome biogenesis GTPase Der [Armatimonadota bacterium]NIM75520.1 ribosome biogenesis GTPase Der [Armatimonadota bacterium]NIN05175.1 ribosome biogenesis GTPase Der [Armatimonadota bacterium]
MSQDRSVVAIVGRPNVGKSTLFNRLAGRRIAVVEETPGITRDRIYADCMYRGRRFSLIDTGGLQPKAESALLAQVRKQAQFAIEEAQLILFVVDGKEGLSPIDYEVTELIRRTGKPSLLVVNKVESGKREQEAQDFFSLATGEPICVSALHGVGIFELLEEMLPHLPESKEEPEEKIVRVAIVGRPNVGKSSIVNAVLGEERVIVDEGPGTTRDAIDSPFKFGGRRFVLIDTAGIRRKSKVKEDFDYYSVLRALGAIERSDVAVLVFDASQGITDQDKRISGYAHEEGCAQVIAANKWDLLSGSEEVPKSWRKMKADLLHHVREQLPFASYAPFCATSALESQGLLQMLEEIAKVARAHCLQIPTAELNRVIFDALDRHPPYYKGRPLKVYYSTQVRISPPTFLLFVNNPELAHFSTLRYLENVIRKAYPLEGTPLRLLVRRSEGKSAARPAKKRRSR